MISCRACSALRAVLGLFLVFGFFAADGATPAATAFGKGGRGKSSHGDDCNSKSKECLHQDTYDSQISPDVQSFSAARGVEAEEGAVAIFVPCSASSAEGLALANVDFAKTEFTSDAIYTPAD